MEGDGKRGQAREAMVYQILMALLAAEQAVMSESNRRTKIQQRSSFSEACVATSLVVQ